MTTKVILSYVLLLRFLIFESLGLAPSAQKSAREFVAYLAHMGATGVAIVMCEFGNIRPLPDIAATLVRRLLGLRGVVVKSHGSADAFAFGFAIRRAIEEARTGVLAHITERMADIHKSAA